jgi:hypothetical protein
VCQPLTIAVQQRCEQMLIICYMQEGGFSPVFLLADAFTVQITPLTCIVTCMVTI